MRDPVLERNMFRKTDAEPSSEGVVSLVKEESDYERRKKQAAELLAAARERQNPENYKTLSEQNRPGVFRPVATGQPQAPQPNTQQQLAQMQAMGFRPVGMADGGYVRRFAEGGLNISGPPPVMIARPSSEPMAFDPMTGFPLTPPDELEEVYLTSDNYRTRRSMPGSLPSASPFKSDEERGIKAIPPKEEPIKEEEPKKDTEKPDVDLTLDDIKARRSENIALAMIQAGLAMAGGQSPNALQNIAAGGISGLQAYSQAEKERRAEEVEQRKYSEDRLARIQRAGELAQDKKLTRETRVLDIAQQRMSDIDREIRGLQGELSKTMGPEDPRAAEIQASIRDLINERTGVQRTVNKSLVSLGYEGDDIFRAEQRPVTPTIGVGSIIYQNGKGYRVTRFENGKPVAAEPID